MFIMCWNVRIVLVVSRKSRRLLERTEYRLSKWSKSSESNQKLCPQVCKTVDQRIFNDISAFLFLCGSNEDDDLNAEVSDVINNADVSYWLTIELFRNQLEIKFQRTKK